MAKLMFGTIWASLPDKGMVRVEFAEDGITTAELPYLVQGSAGSQQIFPLPVGAQVACLMDEHCEDGVVLGAIYSATDTPPGGAPNLYRTVYSDGTVVEYDTEAHAMTTTLEDTEFKVTRQGFTIVRGGESLFAILNDLLAANKAETHPSSTGPTGVPVNLADYIAIENRLPNLFEG